MFTLICTWINGWVNNREADDLRRHDAHYDVSVMASEVTLNNMGKVFDAQKYLHDLWDVLHY